VVYSVSVYRIHLCNIQWRGWLPKTRPAPPHICYYTEFNRSTSKGGTARIWERLGPAPLDREVAVSLENVPLFVLGQNGNERNYGDPPSKFDHLRSALQGHSRSSELTRINRLSERKPPKLMVILVRCSFAVLEQKWFDMMTCTISVFSPIKSWIFWYMGLSQSRVHKFVDRRHRLCRKRYKIRPRLLRNVNRNS